MSLRCGVAVLTGALACAAAVPSAAACGGFFSSVRLLKPGAAADARAREGADRPRRGARAQAVHPRGRGDLSTGSGNGDASASPDVSTTAVSTFGVGTVQDFGPDKPTGCEGRIDLFS